MLSIILAIIVVILVILLYVRHAKTVWKVIGTIVGVILFIIFLALGLTSWLTKSADSMFSDIKAGNVQQAYTATAKEFQSATTLEQFKTFVQWTKLANYKSTTWTDREVNNNQGILKGTVVLEDNTKLPFEINLIKEDSQWKIFTMNVPQGGVTDQTAATGSIPSQVETTVMVHKAMDLFATAISKADFATFYNEISKARQKQTTAADLLKAFKVFSDNKIDFSFTATMEPTYTAIPTIDANGILTVAGTFAAKDGNVIFEQKYFQENGEWKLFGFNVQIK